MVKTALLFQFISHFWKIFSQLCNIIVKQIFRIVVGENTKMAIKINVISKKIKKKIHLSEQKPRRPPLPLLYLPYLDQTRNSYLFLSPPPSRINRPGFWMARVPPEQSICKFLFLLVTVVQRLSMLFLYNRVASSRLVYDYQVFLPSIFKASQL